MVCYVMFLCNSNRLNGDFALYAYGKQWNISQERRDSKYIMARFNAREEQWECMEIEEFYVAVTWIQTRYSNFGIYALVV